MGIRDDVERRLHEQNKREAFDGMRAYHQSEIAHKGHTVEVIKTLLTVVVGAYGGLIALVVNARLTFALSLGLSAALFLAVWLATCHVVRTTNRKVEIDHGAYEAHRSEYLAERVALGIEYALRKTGYETHWRSPSLEHVGGYRYTQRLIVALGVIVVAAAFCGSLLVLGASWARSTAAAAADCNGSRTPL